MTINTSSLLNMLQPSINDNIKEKIQSLSKDGKVEISSLLKEKSVTTLLSSLFNDIIKGNKSKSTISSSLQNSKAMFDFKSVSSDIKDILNNPKIANNPKLEQQVKTLKNFLVDIKDLDDKNLKSNIKNSGVFLESKLLKNSKEFQQSEQKLDLKGQTTKQEVQTQVKSNTISTQTPIKQDIQTAKLEKQLQSLKEFSVNIKDTNTKSQNISEKLQTQQSLKTNTNQEQKLSTDLNTTIKDISKNIDDPKIQKALDNPKLNEQITSLKKFLGDIKSLDDKSIKQNTQNIAKLIQSQVQSKSIDSGSLEELKTTLDQVKQQIQNPKIQQEPLQNKQINTLKQFMSDIKELDDKSQNIASKTTTSPQEIKQKVEQSITNDLKATLLQVKDQVDDPKIQKVLDQISYHQLLSFSSYSNSSFLPFMWDNVEDGSVNFTSNEKEIFTCSIDLQLKNYGEFKSVLLLEQKNNISINLRIKSDTLKTKVQDNLKTLREGINKIGLNLVSLNILTYNDTVSKEQKAYQDNIDKLSYGIDIKA